MPAPRTNCALGTREQSDQTSSYLDASSIYGNSRESSNRLRSFIDGQSIIIHLSHTLVSGKLLTSASLPPRFDAEIDSPSDNNCKSSSCFIGGSNQINLLPTVTALHTIWVRQHNRIASILMVGNGYYKYLQLLSRYYG
jgi:hypothetical protein